MSPHPSPPHTPTFCAGPAPPRLPTPLPTDKWRDAAGCSSVGAQLEAPSPLTLPSPGAAFTNPPSAPNVHVKDPEARWAPLKCTSTGSCPVHTHTHPPRHTKARWSRRMEGVSPQKHVSVRIGPLGARWFSERGGGEGERSRLIARSRDLGLAGRSGFVITTIVCALGKEGRKISRKTKKKRKTKNNKNY